MINFVSGKKYYNRYKDEYVFEKIDDTFYTLKINMEYCRYGGKEYESFINTDDLGMVDPSGGPYLAPGNFSIDGNLIKRIFLRDEVIKFEMR